MSESDARVKWFRARNFCLRDDDGPDLSRASGDSGFVAHLSACTHGATGWDWSFRLVKPGPTWAFVSDGRLSIFLDEPGQFVPPDAKVGDLVAVRLPRARENFFPHRFTVYGGQGGAVIGQGFTKFFLPISYEDAPLLVDTFTNRLTDQIRFSLYVANSPRDFDRSDSAIVDVGPQDEPGVIRVLEAFLRSHQKAVKSRGMPHGTESGPLGLARGNGQNRADLADGFGWRVSQQAVQSGIELRR